MADAGKFPAGTTEIPFEFTVEPVEGMTLTETYHGVYVNVTYGCVHQGKHRALQRTAARGPRFNRPCPCLCSVNAILTRGGFSRNIEEFIEFNVQVPVRVGSQRRSPRSMSHPPLTHVTSFPSLSLCLCVFVRTITMCAVWQSRGAVDPSPVEFEIRPDSLENVRKTSVAQIPKFRVRGILHQTSCSLSRAFTGQLVVEESEARIRSLELQLVRVESVATGAGGDMVTESTEIQNLQLGDGDVSRGLPLPIYMVFPRLFTCPTVVSERFRVEFEVNIIIIFEDNYMVTENFEVKLFR